MEQHCAAFEELAIGRPSFPVDMRQRHWWLMLDILMKMSLHQGLMQICTNTLNLTQIFSKSIMGRRQSTLF
jgi:hypothetical protein